MIQQKLLNTCRTCGSEVVESVNESLFKEGECDACERKRYESQSALLSACEAVMRMIERHQDVIPTEALVANEGYAVLAAAVRSATTGQTQVDLIADLTHKIALMVDDIEEMLDDEDIDMSSACGDRLVEVAQLGAGALCRARAIHAAESEGSGRAARS